MTVKGVTFIGGGSFGTALAIMLAKKGYNIKCDRKCSGRYNERYKISSQWLSVKCRSLWSQEVFKGN